MIFAGPAQALTTRVRPEPVLGTGLALLTLGMVWNTQVSPDGSYASDLLPGFIAVGIGTPETFPPSQGSGRGQLSHLPVWHQPL